MHRITDPDPAVPATGARRVYTISELNRAVAGMLESEFPLIWVEGEISNFSRPSSGHLYFTLKDAQAQVRCALFRNRALLLRCKPDNGMRVLARARLSLYEARGDYQLIVEHLEEAGAGALLRAYEKLKHRLAAEGLFDEHRKRPLPALPARVGVVTSATGAAIRDILTTLKRRFPALPALIYPVPVQGAEAAGKIAAALRLAGTRRDCDVLILARGGGSLEDLWSFNDEGVARAIAACPIPVVTGIGHEVDFTIADFVADCRAPTPTAAAELVSPDGAEWLARFSRHRQRLTAAWNRSRQDRIQRLQWLARCLAQQHPGQRLRQYGQRADELELRLAQAWRTTQRHRGLQLAALDARLHRHLPVHQLEQYAMRLENRRQRLHAARERILERAHTRLAHAAHALDAVNPLAVLGRGYAIVQRAEGTVVRAAADVTVGDSIETRVSAGTITSIVTGVEDT